MNLLDVAMEAARAGGAVLRARFSGERQVEYKGERDLVTDADRASETQILAILHRACPSHRVLTEESGDLPPAWGTMARGMESEYQWVIDPLDGTTNFAHAIPAFGVSIGLVKGGRLTLGVVYNPMSEELFSAEKGLGACLNGRPITASRVERLIGAVAATGFPYDVGTSLDHNLDHLCNLVPRLQGIRRSGAAALDLAYVACGRFDAFWEYGLAPWDMAAGALLVEEAGGQVTGFRGEPFSWRGLTVAASNGRIHDELLQVLAMGETGLRGSPGTALETEA